MYKNIKKEYPEVTENFRNCISVTLDNLPDTSDKNKNRCYPAVRIAALTAAIIALLTVSVFGANTVYEKFVEKNNYKVSLFPDEKETENSVENEQLTEKTVEYVKLGFGYMPDYLIAHDAPYKFGLKAGADADTSSGLTFQLFERELAKDLEIFYAGSVTECMFGENMGAVMKTDTGIESDGNGYDKEFLINFDDFGYVLRCYVSERISEDEMMKIANGLYLEESDKSEAFITDTYIPTSDNGGIMTPDSGGFSYATDTVVRQLGESFDIKAYNRDVDGNDYTLTVKSIDIRDNVKGLDLSSFNFAGEVSDYVDENGNFKSYERKTYNYGDGINSIHTLKESENVGRKIILIDIDVTNNENFANEFYINTGICSVSGVSAVNGINIFDASYISGQQGGSGGFYLIPFDAGENKTVTYGFIVDSDVDFADLVFSVESLWNIMNCVMIE